MTCEYNFTVEWHRTLSKACWDCPFNKSDCFRPQCVSGDGNYRSIMTVNRQLPGPPIEICAHDRVVVWVTNHLRDGSTTSMHWHGIHQRGTPYMDGAVHVTQCPIQPFESFRYDFVPWPPGTHWYHSHTGIQMGDGLFGPFVIRETETADPNSALYDEDLSEHVMVIVDWMPETSHDRFLRLMHDAYSITDMSALINGRASIFEVMNTYNTSGSALTSAKTPMSTFHVERDKRYRFRVISAAQKCPFRIFFDDHSLQIIATDGNPASPATVDSMIMAPGERYDIVITTDQPVDNYWIRAIGLRDCWYTNGTVTAILKYQGAPDEDPDGDPFVYTNGTMFGPIPDHTRPTYFGDGYPTLTVSELNSTGRAAVNLTNQPPDVTHYIAMSFLNNDNSVFNNADLYNVKSLPRYRSHFTPTMNNITFRLPPVPLLSQPDDVEESWFCNRSTINHTLCEEDLCLCIHRLHVHTGQMVELVVADIFESDEVGAGHPMHLHGYSFHVLAMERYDGPFSLEHIEEMDRQGLLPRKLINPPLKDTVHIPNKHYAIIRFRANNPGIWFFHCHIDTHLAQGKALLIQDGDRLFFPPLPDVFPRCGGFGTRNALRTNQAELCDNGASGTVLSKLGVMVIILVFTWYTCL
ncbi:hypothetical protein BaRGS_00020885, partial [Batillaria attramentaria]